MNIISKNSSLRLKILRVMKLITFILLAFTLQISASGLSQNVTLSVKNVQVQEVLKQISRQTGISIIYSESYFDNAERLTIDVKDTPIREVLNLCLAENDYTFTLEDGMVIISKVEEAEDNPESPDISEITIKGKVTDSKGKPLPNATVMIKGTFKGITTNVDGEYSITVPDSKAILVFSYIGFAKKEIVVGNKTSINVTLEQSAMELEGVTINAGYYTVTEKTKTGNISKLDAKQIDKQPVTNPLQALQGRMPGVNIQQTTGLPGGGFRIQIRGQNSIRRSLTANVPLYVINGVPYSSTSLGGAVGGPLERKIDPLNSINPSDIESIEILKDADATAIYGSRGANGVVLITTKKGKAGKTTYTINHSTGIAQVANKIDVLNTEQYREMMFEGLANDGFDPVPDFFKPFLPQLFAWDSTRNADWQEELIGGTAFTTNTQASVSGGNANTQFLLSSTYRTEETVFPGNFSYNRFSGLLNVKHVSDDSKFKVDISVNVSSDKNILPEYDLTKTAVQLAPNAPELYDENGEINWENNTFYNPVAALELRKYEAKTSALITNASLSYKILHNLSLKARLGYVDEQVEEISTEPLAARRPDTRDSWQASLDISDNRKKTWTIEPQMEYFQNIGRGHLIALIGVSFHSTINKGETIYAWGFPSDLLIENPQAADNLSIRPVFAEYRYNSIFARLNYNWKDKYILNLTARRDGSSRFGPGKRFANFGAIGAAWIFSSEKFITESLSFLSYGKLRGSYGTTGNDQIGDYQYLNTYKLGSFPYQENKIGLIPSRLPNDNFSWETTKKLELAIELGFINDRLLFSASWYLHRSSDQLTGLPLPLITGDRRIEFNIPALIQNKGLEFELSTINIQSDDFEWSSRANLSIQRNKLVEFPDFENSEYSNVYQIGKSLHIQRIFNALGVDSETGKYTFEDMNGDGQITYGDDLFFSEEITQDYFGGFQNTIRYKNIELDFFFQFKKQTGPSYVKLFSHPGSSAVNSNNQPTVVLDRWQKPGDVTEIQKYTLFMSSSDYQLFRNSNAAIVDASFIRLKNVSLSYTLPRRISEKLNLQNFRVYIQAQNLFTITNYLGLDPESQSLRLPPLRTITVGMQLTF